MLFRSHPHAVDGGKLRAAAAAAAGAGPPLGGAVDIVPLLERWSDQVGAAVRGVRELAGAAGGGVGPATPLAAAADARSHAPHLRALLAEHGETAERLRALQSALHMDTAAAGARRARCCPSCC